MRSLAKINLSGILKAHYNTLVDASTKQRQSSISDKFVFFVLPLLVAILGAFLIVPSDKNILGVLITSLSIFAGLLFNLLVLVMQIIEKKKGTTDFIKLQKETYANIAYAILVALVASAILLIPYFIESEPPPPGQKVEIAIWGRIFWAIVYFLLLNFAVTMAMILRRMHAILLKIMDY